ncbi:MAG: helix-turn-helix transcriptional regulator [Clostridia bacterium]|nr:helix-turn-helix transcriptional regulator [Clostridia bacterium]
MNIQSMTEANCPVELTLAVIGGKWKVLILWHLYDEGTKRFGELKNVLQGITQKMLIQQLKELERDGLIHREVYQQVPPKVEYSLTERGRSLKAILDAMCHWGNDYAREMKIWPKEA